MASLSRIVLFAALGALAVPARMPAQLVDQRDVKAAFVYNFSRYVEWPAEVFKNATDPIIICVFGENEIVSALESAVKGKDVEGRPISVSRLLDVRKAGVCHILFIGQSDKKRIASIMAALKDTSTLTIGEGQSFIACGGMVAFINEEDRLRLQISLDTAREAGLSISARLLNIAQIVGR